MNINSIKTVDPSSGAKQGTCTLKQPFPVFCHKDDGNMYRMMRALGGAQQEFPWQQASCEKVNVEGRLGKAQEDYWGFSGE